MAIIHPAVLVPGKLEALAAWLPEQSWSEVPAGTQLERVSSYRFDDPAGEVGVEIHLVRRIGEDRVIQVPLSYRGAPLDGAEEHLVTEMDHSVLGRRWVYDAAIDPVFITEAIRTIRSEGENAAEMIQAPDGAYRNPDVAQVRGARSAGLDADFAEAEAAAEQLNQGSSAQPPVTVDAVLRIPIGAYELLIPRFPLAGAASLDILGADAVEAAEPADVGEPSDGTELGVLRGRWDGMRTPVELARLQR